MARLPRCVLLVSACACVPAERDEAQQAAAREASARPRPRPRAQLVPVGSLAPRAGAAPGKTADPEALPVLTRPFTDDFERQELGDAYHATSAAYRIEGGRLCVKAARNRPLWLRHRLPKNARIQVDVETASSDGDIKLEAWGNGRSAATGVSYTNATSYLAIFGGWKNRYHVLARIDEHATDRPEISIDPGSEDPRQQPVLADRSYRIKLERSDGRTLRFGVDDVELLSFVDPAPLSGSGHEHFAFNDWETPVCFDNLRIEPLPG